MSISARERFRGLTCVVVDGVPTRPIEGSNAPDVTRLVTIPNYTVTALLPRNAPGDGSMVALDFVATESCGRCSPVTVTLRAEEL